MRTGTLMINEFDPTAASERSKDVQALIDRRLGVLGPSYRLFYEEPIHFVRGNGVKLFDEKGQEFLDAYNNVPCVGHCHPEVVAAMLEQASTLNTHTRYLSEPIVDYAEDLVATFPDHLNRVMFTCTGSEANDLAMRIARERTGNEGIIVTSNAYHGITSDVAAFSPSLGAGNEIGQHVRLVRAPDAFRSGERGVGAEFETAVKAAIDDLANNGIKPAALIVDTIFSSDGVLSHPPGFLRGAVNAIQSPGGLFIADEVQAGFARTGDEMWGFQRHGVSPDIVTMGKPMGNGMPIAGLVSNEDVLDGFGKKARYFNTFGGNPVSCAAAHAVLRVIQRESLQANAKAVGGYLRKGIEKISEASEIVGEVRGAGLFIGVDIVKDKSTRAYGDDYALALVNEMRKRRVLIAASGKGGHALKVRPPLVFSESNADQFLDAFESSVAMVERSL